MREELKKQTIEFKEREQQYKDEQMAYAREMHARNLLIDRHEEEQRQLKIANMLKLKAERQDELKGKANA